MTHVSLLPVLPDRASRSQRRDGGNPPCPRVAEGTSSMPDDGDGALASEERDGMVASGSRKVTVRLIG